MDRYIFDTVNFNTGSDESISPVLPPIEILPDDAGKDEDTYGDVIPDEVPRKDGPGGEGNF